MKDTRLYSSFSLYLNFLVNVPAGSVGDSGGVLPWLCFFGALLNGCNFRCGRGDGWSIFTALIIWFGMSRTESFDVSICTCGWFHSICAAQNTHEIEIEIFDLIWFDLLFDCFFFKLVNTHFWIDFDNCCRSWPMQVRYSDWLVYYVSASMDCIHGMQNLQMCYYLCAVMQSYRGIVCVLRSCIQEIDLVKIHNYKIKLNVQVKWESKMEWYLQLLIEWKWWSLGSTCIDCSCPN